MEVRLEIGIKQLIELIRQLPIEQKLKIKKEVEKDIFSDKKAESSDDLTALLLSGPTMSDVEEEKFKKFNEEFAKWTKNLSA